ncbi:hypothetical protein Asulf_01163 [Archaeoglobus sulfaticallidus PM70-1]|uniref:Uncharacterized protein n=1 Tax=Archaeoglobus sulfaticallidus PM70-1 TaxID=387631 RepID=N0BFU6_9EURY|nr:hypothetical protein [Archaeoglobus sulfaticallidus]AGK61162.1 hypothetical protein Asulf_01163 [Archaeoglobus sulfaticallidus PM70-1]
MNRDEARKVLEVLAKADGGCEFCARELFNNFIQEFPEFSDLAKTVFKKKFNKDLDE